MNKDSPIPTVIPLLNSVFVYTTHKYTTILTFFSLKIARYKLKKEKNTYLWEKEIETRNSDFRNAVYEFISHNSEKIHQYCEKKVAITFYFIFVLFFIRWQKQASIVSLS